MFKKNKTFKKILLRISIALGAFLIILFALNFVNDVIEVTVLDKITQYLNLNVFAVITIFVLATIAQLASKFGLPWNLVSPLLKAITITFAIRYALFLIVVIAATIDKDMTSLVELVSTTINPLIFVGVLIFGYASIIKQNIFKEKKKNGK